MVAGSTTIVTAMLVAITWNYANSTKSIAMQTANAAQSARDAAQISLLQSLLAVQPLLAVTSVDVEYMSPGGGDANTARTPIRITWLVANLGHGVAFDPRVSVELVGHSLVLNETQGIPISLDPSGQLQLVHALEYGAWTAVGQSLQASGANAVGRLVATCNDAFGGRVHCEVPLLVRDGSIIRGAPVQMYNDSEDTRARLQRLLRRVLVD
jgi:hypothetical protein